MQGLMQDVPLALDRIFSRAETLWKAKRILTSTPAGIEETTYGAWAERTRRLGGVIESLGVSQGGRVATFAWNTSRHLELYFAAPCTGRVLHTLNIRLFAEQLTYIIDHAEDEVIFVERSLLPILWPVLDECSGVRNVVVIDDTAGVADPPEIPDDPRVSDYEELLAGAQQHEFGVVSDENVASGMCYTSGTTGDPKGVVYSHRSVVLHSLVAALGDSVGMTQADLVMPVVPMFHANAWGMCHSAVLVGAELMMPGPDLSPAALAGLIVDQGVTVSGGVPTIWMGVKDHLVGKPHKLRTILCGGSAAPKALSEAYRKEIGLPLRHAWGMTETSPLASICVVRSEHEHDDEEALAELRSTQGLALPLVDLRIADPTTGEAQPWDGEATGEVQVGGPWIASSYFNDERGAGSFAADGWLRTGDVGTISPEAYIRLVDRTKDLIKSGGEWISSVELENHLMGHPSVAEAAVIAIPSDRWMERPMACVVLKPGASATADELIEWLRPRVARWWIPDSIEFIDEVPKTSVGKFSKKDLRDRFADRRVP